MVEHTKRKKHHDKDKYYKREYALLSDRQISPRGPVVLQEHIMAW